MPRTSKKISLFFLFCSLSCLNVSCAEPGTPIQNQNTPNMSEENNSNTPDMMMTEPTARYKVTFSATWSSRTHPTGFPSNPHFSGLVGVTHKNGSFLWGRNHQASPGIRSMAETGSKTILLQEVDTLIQQGFADQPISGPGIPRSPAQVSLEFEIQKSHPFVSLTSMLAPSPDWFVGVSNLSLFESDSWVERKVINLALYDAGTDSGRRFTSSNLITRPQSSIARLTSQSSDTDFVDGRDYVGQFIFERL